MDFLVGHTEISLFTNVSYMNKDSCLSDGSDGKESDCSVGEPGSIPGWGRSPEVWNDNPLQYTCLKNSTDRISLADCTVYGIAESEMTKWACTHTFMFPWIKTALNVQFNEFC